MNCFERNAETKNQTFRNEYEDVELIRELDCLENKQDWESETITMLTRNDYYYWNMWSIHVQNKPRDFKK